MKRFWDKVNKRGGIHPVLKTRCWLWTAGKTGAGYGAFKLAGRTLGAHVLSFLWSGEVIPWGFELDHLCRHRDCVRPDHLEAVTHAENTRRGENFIAVHAAKTVCKRGHEFDGKQRSGRKCTTCINLTQRSRRTAARELSV